MTEPVTAPTAHPSRRPGGPALPPAPASRPPGSRPATQPIVLDAVSRWFGNVVAVNDISFAIGSGITGLLGPNGAGKSTLLHLLSGLLEPSAGRVLIEGRPAWRDPRDLPPDRPGARARGRPAVPDGPSVRRAAARLQGLPDPAAAARRGDRDGRARPGRRSDGRDLLEGDAPAGEDRGSPRPRAADPAARRAVQRHGSPAAAAHDGSARGRWARRAGRSCSARTSSRRSSDSPTGSSSSTPAGSRRPATTARSAG